MKDKYFNILDQKPQTGRRFDNGHRQFNIMSDLLELVGKLKDFDKQKFIEIIRKFVGAHQGSFINTNWQIFGEGYEEYEDDFDILFDEWQTLLSEGKKVPIKLIYRLMLACIE